MASVFSEKQPETLTNTGTIQQLSHRQRQASLEQTNPVTFYSDHKTKETVTVASPTLPTGTQTTVDDTATAAKWSVLE